MIAAAAEAEEVFGVDECERFALEQQAARLVARAPIEVKPGKIYANGWGERHRIMGPVGAHPGIVWAQSGFWFRAADGRACRDGHHPGVPWPERTAHDLVKEVEPNEWGH